MQFLKCNLLNRIRAKERIDKRPDGFEESRNSESQDRLDLVALKRILVRGDSYLCRKSSTRFSPSAQADPISGRVLGNASSDR